MESNESQLSSEKTSTLNMFVESLKLYGFLDDEIFDGDRLTPYNACTFPTEQKALLVVKPIPADEKSLPDEFQDSSRPLCGRYDSLISLIELAKQHRLPLYPISCGKNWGYGSTIPMGQSAIVLDLSNFNRISHFDPISHQVTVEPGVTQQQLFEFLRANGDQYCMDATGAPKSSSIIGNTLECGFGHTTIAERSKNVLNLSVIIPWGADTSASLASTSLNGSFDDRNNMTRVMNLGPDYSTIMLQSNVSVTVNMTIALKMRADAFCAYFIDLTDIQFAQYVDLARVLRAKGVIHSASHIGNKHKAIQMALKHYPYSSLGDQCPMPDHEVERVCEQFGIADWTASGAIYGTSQRVAADKDALKRAANGIGANVVFIDDKRLAKMNNLVAFFDTSHIGKIVKQILRKAPGKLSVLVNKLSMFEDLKALYYLKQGVPTDHFVKTAFWRTRRPPAESDSAINPHDYNAGFMWIAPCTPIESKRVVPLVSIIEQIALDFGFEPAISMTLLNERAAECVISLSYDRDSPEEEQRAVACHQQLLEQSGQRGHYVYRMSSLSSRSDLSVYLEQEYDRLELKSKLDPLDVIGPGKYRNIFLSE